MNGKSWLSIVATAIAGVLLIVFFNHGEILSWIVVVFGVCLIVPAVYNIVLAMRSPKPTDSGVEERGGSRGATIVASLAAIALGIWMLCSPGFFVGLIVYLFGAGLLIYGIYEMVWAGWLARPFRMPLIFYLVPFLMIVGGVVILCTSVRTMNNVMMLITGILLLCIAINSMLEYVAMHPVKTKE